MLSWSMLGTTTGAVLFVHAVLFVTRRLFPHAPMTLVALVTAEKWSLTHMLLWTSNGLIVTAMALGGLTAIQSMVSRA